MIGFVWDWDIAITASNISQIISGQTAKIPDDLVKGLFIPLPNNNVVEEPNGGAQNTVVEMTQNLKPIWRIIMPKRGV